MKKQQKKRKHYEDGFEQWGGYMNAKISKLEAQYQEEKVSAAKNNHQLSSIFNGVAIFVNGYTEPSADELRCLMLLHGGVYHHYYRSGKTTHIIASSLPNTKFNQFKNLKIVKCEWITESVKAQKLLDYKNYLLENDLRTRNSTRQNDIVSMFNSKKGELKVSKTAADEGYLKEFYSNSRLHYISRLGSILKQYVWEKRENHNGVFPGRKKLENQELFIEPEFLEERVIMHMDMDSFFVSVALRNYPHLKGQPVAVTHARTNMGSNRENVSKKFEVDFYKKKMVSKIKSINKEKSESSDEEIIDNWSKEVCSMSEIASCSYEARMAGVQKGMYLGSALKLCPNLKTVPYDFEGYKEVSMTLYNTVTDYTLDVEAVSCDELFIDCTTLLGDVRISPTKLAEILRQEIENKTKCTASIGIGSNKLQARLATKRAKPNGQFYLTPDAVDDFIKDLSIYDIPGVGRSIGCQLKSLKIKTCGDLQKLSLATLQKEFGGKTGESLYKNCRGIDERKVNFSHERKSVSAEMNYGIRFNDDEETEVFLKQLSEEVAMRLKDVKMTAKGLTFKLLVRAKDAPIETAKYLGHGACDAITRSSGLPSATDDAQIIAKHVINLYRQLNIPANELRGIGIHMSKLETVKKSSKTLQKYFDNKSGGDRGVPESSKKIEPEIEKSKPEEKREVRLGGFDRLPPASQIDFEVLASLPQDIRSEIFEEYGITIKLPQNDNEGTDGNESKETGQKENGRNSEDELKVKEAILKFHKFDLAEMKIMIKEWVTAEHQPQTFDVYILKSYLKNLVELKKLERLCILIRCFHRQIKTHRTEVKAWHNAYDETFDTVQETMVIVFGRPLGTLRT